MDPLVQAAGTALVGAIATEAWQQVKEAVVALWSRVHPDRASRVDGELEELRQQMLRVRSDDDQGTEHALEGAWQLRVQELLRADPALAADLQHVLDQVLRPALADGQRQAGTILMTGSSHDSSTFTQIGLQINNGR